MKSRQLVDLPTKRITYKNGPNGTKYVYYTVRSYRNAQGNPTSDEKSIGKLDEATGQLIPNKNYFDLFPSERKDHPETVRSVGYFEVFSRLAESIGLTQTLTHNFGRDSEKLLAIAAFMMGHGNVMMDYPDWADSTSHPKVQAMTSQKLSEFFADLDNAKQLGFFRQWLTKAQEQEYIAYDVTSISSYSEEIAWVERGYNRDKENLAQINLGMFFGETTKLPLYYSMYSGSIVDKTYLPFMMALAETIGMNHVRFVMDQGFMTRDNLTLMSHRQHTALSLIPKNLKMYKELLAEVIQHPFSSRERLNTQGIYARSIERVFDGVPVMVHLYFDQQKALLSENALFDEVGRHEKQLNELAKQKKLTPTLKKYFEVEETGEKELIYRIDYDKIDRLKAQLGYFALISTDKELSAEQALSTYRQKDVIEKSFDQLKNGMDYRRMRTHYTKTTEGKLFVAFLGLIMRSVFMQAIKENEATERLTMKKVIRELEKIQHLQLKDGTTHMLPLTSTQKIILKALTIDATVFN